MALQACRECGKQVSTNAATCPHCGTPAPTKPAATGAILKAVVGLVVFVGVWLVMSGGPGSGLIGSAIGIGDADYTVRVTGSPGLAFTGSYLQVSAGGTSNSESIEGTVPKDYTAHGS